MTKDLERLMFLYNQYYLKDNFSILLIIIILSLNHSFSVLISLSFVTQ